MKKFLLLIVIFANSLNPVKAQSAKGQVVYHPNLSKQNINSVIHDAYNSGVNNPVNVAEGVKSNHTQSAFSIINKMNEVKKIQFQKIASQPHNNKSLDTVFVYANDTMVISGVYLHTGPIFVFNHGVLIIHNATVTEYGDVFVFQNGKVLADSSSLTFPQQYFYQRSFIVVQDGSAYFNTCSFNYSGMSHNLVVGDSGLVSMNNIHQNDWTTAGLFGGATIKIHGLNLGGEFILSDSSHTVFNHVDTLMLWHQFPNTAMVNYAFPQGDTVQHYVFNNTIIGVSGIKYHVNVDTCYNVWWALMPVNGSNITLSNSNIRSVGAWFQHGDSIGVTGLVNNTFYPNVILPLADRNLHLKNCFVETWSLYAFDSSHVDINSCTLGEVGTEQKSKILSQQFLLDGSGGYFWATDTSIIYASNTTVYSTVRSEKNGIFVLAYSTMPYQGPSSIGNSLLVSVQNNLAADPVPYDGSICWMENIESPSTAHSDSLILVKGSEWIDQGPQGSWMDFTSYSFYYQLQGATSWIPIVRDSTLEIHHNTLAKWNTNGLIPGAYKLRLLVKNTLGDSVEDIKAVTLLAGTTAGVNQYAENGIAMGFFPNPAKTMATIRIHLDKSTQVKMSITDIVGKELEVITDTKLNSGDYEFPFDATKFANGIYLCKILTTNKMLTEKIVVQR